MYNVVLNKLELMLLNCQEISVLVNSIIRTPNFVQNYKITFSLQKYIYIVAQWSVL